MDWILKNIEIVIAIAGAIAYWLNQRAAEKSQDDSDEQTGDSPVRRDVSPMGRGEDSEEAERARRIREEIQRKIAERRARAAGAPSAPQPAAPTPPPLDPFRPVFEEAPQPTPPPLYPVEPPAPAVAAYEDPDALERQRRLAAQLEELETQRREAQRRAEQARRAAKSAPEVTTTVSQNSMAATRDVGAELRDPRALRRAFVLKEVLSEPVAFR